MNRKTVCLILTILATATFIIAVRIARHQSGIKETRLKLLVKQPEKAGVFVKWQLEIALPDELAVFRELSATQINDAYDADRDGTFARLYADFTIDNKTTRVPGFAMKKAPDSKWVWRLRWSPQKVGVWTAVLHFEAKNKGTQKVHTIQELKPIEAIDMGREGPLLPPDARHQGYLRELQPDGSSKATWLFGTCRPWVVRNTSKTSEWRGQEWIDRQTELFAPMREGGFNLLNQWMAPWEYLLVHHERKEHWRRPNGEWDYIPIKSEEAWAPHRYYDQGRAADFDRLIEQCEDGELIRLLLVPLPHPLFRHIMHPWHDGYSGWSPWESESDYKGNMNGFCLTKEMEAWDFFKANPRAEHESAEAKLFDHQANYYRYLFARWGYSRAIGVWVLLDEIEGIGDEEGYLPIRSGYWAHPECQRWLADMVRLFKGRLRRPHDGQRYQGDPYNRPLHATTSGFRALPGEDQDWTGGSHGTRPDLLGWHWYPNIETPIVDWNEQWRLAIDGVRSFTLAPHRQARLISEFGATERRSAENVPSSLYPTLYHFAIWAAVMDGHAGTPMDWNDGKFFGELTSRRRNGLFSKRNYPINLLPSMQALRRYLKELNPDELQPCADIAATVTARPDGKMRLHCLYKQDRTAAYGWFFSTEKPDSFSILGLVAGRYELEWYDSWTGKALPSPRWKIVHDGHGPIRVNAHSILQNRRQSAKHFPYETRNASDNDLAFKLTRVGECAP